MCLIILNKVCTMYLVWSQDKHFHNILIVKLFFFNWLCFDIRIFNFTEGF